MSEHTAVKRPGWAHAVYAVVLIFALTQGPVLSWWIRRPENAFSTKDIATWATYLVAVLPAAWLSQRADSRKCTQSSPALFYVLFVGWMCLSFAWSSVPQVTVPAVLALAFTTLAGLYLATQFETLELAVIVVVAMVPGLLLSELANHRHWQYSLDAVPHWTGIYLNRNSLGPPAVMAILTSAILVAQLLAKQWSAWRPAQLLALLGVIALGLHLQLHGGSRTSWVFLVAAIGVAAMWILVLSLSRSADLELPRVILAGTLVAAIGVIVVAIYLGNNPISTRLGTSSDFSGRRVYWRYSLSVARDHITVGEGWMSPWFDPISRVRLPPELVNETYSHSSFLDVLGGGGLVGIALLILTVSVSFLHIARRRMPLILQGWALGLCTGVLIAASQESFLIGYHFLYLLFVAVACSQPTTTNSRTLQRTHTWVQRRLQFERSARPVGPG